MADAKNVTKKIKDDEIKFVDLRFTDPRGKMQHVTMDAKIMDEEAFTDGIMFDGSSIAGWKVINEFGHEAHARSRLSRARSVLRAEHARHLLRRARALDQRALRARSPLDRRQGASLFEADRRRRYRGVRAGGRILRVRRRPLLRGALQLRLQDRLDRIAVQHRYRVRDGQSRPPAPHQGRLFPGAAGRLGARPSLGDAVGDGRHGRRHREASP